MQEIELVKNNDEHITIYNVGRVDIDMYKHVIKVIALDIISKEYNTMVFDLFAMKGIYIQ